MRHGNPVRRGDRVRRGELTRLTWPLPWWVALMPAVVIAIVSYLYVAQASDWAYIEQARLSGMLRESVIIIGPIACLCAAWVAERFTNRRSPLSWSTHPRAAGQQGLRILGVIAVAWMIGQMVGGGVSTLVQEARATGGTFYGIELVFAALSLVFFTVSGFLIGAVVCRWHAVLWAALWSLLWVGVLPLYYSDFFVDSGRNTEYFIFPALQSSDHRALEPVTVGVLLVWWIIVVVCLGWFLRAWYRSRARVGHGSLLVSGGAVVLLAAAGFVLPHILPASFNDEHPRPLACEPLGQLEVCLIDEQIPMLDVVAEGVQPVIDRMGEHLPEQITTILSYRAIPAALASGYQPDEFLVVNVGTTGDLDLQLDVGMSLGGIDACESSGRAVNWAFAFGHWVSGTSDPGSQADPLVQLLDSKPEDVVLDWYSEHASEIRNCAYVGDGPQ